MKTSSKKTKLIKHRSLQSSESDKAMLERKKELYDRERIPIVNWKN